MCRELRHVHTLRLVGRWVAKAQELDRHRSSEFLSRSCSAPIIILVFEWLWRRASSSSSPHHLRHCSAFLLVSAGDTIEWLYGHLTCYIEFIVCWQQQCLNSWPQKKRTTIQHYQGNGQQWMASQRFILGTSQVTPQRSSDRPSSLLTSQKSSERWLVSNSLANV